jgi:hypothetical protein
VKIRPDTVKTVSHIQRARGANVRLVAAMGLGVTSIAVSVLLIATDGIEGGITWSHHAGVSAAPLLLVGGAIAAVSVAHPAKGRHGIMRLVAVLAFTAWGIAQAFPDSPAAGALNDAAILLFVIDAACAVITDVTSTRRADFPPASLGTRKNARL